MLSSNWFEDSACKGCEYGERITSGIFCAEIQGLVPIGYQGCKAQYDFYEERYKMENGITLAEFAKKLREILKFDYLTCDGSGNLRDYCIWLDKPDYVAEEGWTLQLRYEFVTPLLVLESYRMAVNIDLSEYADDDGNVDYSKCIVEVE